MTKQGTLFAVGLVGISSMLLFEQALAAGILGFQPGDRSEKENASWLKKGIENIQMAIKEVEEGDVEKSVGHGKAAMAALKEIGSEGWDGRRQRSIRSVRFGVSAAKEGNLEKASSDYREALKKLADLKYGDLNFTHESFLGIGKLGTSGRDMAR